MRFYDWLHSRSSRSLFSFRINCYSSCCPIFWFVIHFYFSRSIALEEREHAYYYTINAVPKRRLHHWNKNWKEHLDCVVYTNYQDKHHVSHKYGNIWQAWKCLNERSKTNLLCILFNIQHELTHIDMILLISLIDMHLSYYTCF